MLVFGLWLDACCGDVTCDITPERERGEGRGLVRERLYKAYNMFIIKKKKKIITCSEVFLGSFIFVQANILR